MIRHLTAADYTTMPWANGKGTTVEMIRVNKPDGSLLWRLSMASVVEDGPFSMFPGIERNLTVISGPGFDLVGGHTLRADMLVPVAFPGDWPVSAAGVTKPCQDFNVMTDRSLPRPQVTVLRAGTITPPKDGQVCLLALEKTTLADRVLAQHDLLISDARLNLTSGLVIAVVMDRV